MYKSRFYPLLIAVLILLTIPAKGQQKIKVVTYNVENLFDTVDDPEVEDEEFLPTSSRQWTQQRYVKKLRGIARVISSIGEWDVPAIVGLCEVENDSVMHHLLRRTPLRAHPYSYCLSAKSDPRGIRVAMLYRHDLFKLIGKQSVPVPVSRRATPTRDILHVWLQTPVGDTLDVAVCHFPSMTGTGNHSTRATAAQTLNKLCDSIARIRSNPLIIAMGDLNAHRGSSYLKDAAGKTLCLLPLAAYSGSYKFRGLWEQIDHILVHCSMKNEQSPISFVSGSLRVYQPSFLLTTRRSVQGPRPHRTYAGPYYEGGVSDHLPVVAEFKMHMNVDK